jgi:Amt family ammonium transporter
VLPRRSPLASTRPPRRAATEAAPPAPVPVPNKGDTAWLITATLLVILMAIPGLAPVLRRHGARQEHALGADAGVVIFSLLSVLWAVYGYSLAFTEGNAFIGGFDKLFLKGVTPETWPPPSARAWCCPS